MAKGHICFWTGFYHGSGDRCLWVKGGDLRIPKLKGDLLQFFCNKEKRTIDGASSSSYCVCGVQVVNFIYIFI